MSQSLQLSAPRMISSTYVSNEDDHARRLRFHYLRVVSNFSVRLPGKLLEITFPLEI